MVPMFKYSPIIIRGAGDIASGVAHKLFRSGFPIIMTEIEKPICVRRKVSFANCIYEGQWEVEGVKAKKANTLEDILEILDQGMIPVFVDEECNIKNHIRPKVLIDATLAKKNTGISKSDAPIVIGLGPGFEAGRDVHTVIETNRGHDLGRLIFQGHALSDTGVPSEVRGHTVDRVIRAPITGKVRNIKRIGHTVKKGEIISLINDMEVKANIDGMIRGLIFDGLEVNRGMKIGDIDPRKDFNYVSTISDKARCIAGGVLEAILIKNKKI